MQYTRLSSKGQIVLPHSIRAARNWVPGTEFAVEESREGIFLRPASLRPHTRLEDVAGSLPPRRAVATLDSAAAIEAAISAEVARRHARGRY